MAASGAKQRLTGAVKQVTKSNFAAALQQFKAHIDTADFVAVSCRKTGDCSTSSLRHPWRRILPIDTPEIAYLKAKLAAESYDILQFAICPFRLHGSKVLAFPYNFHLFPRDELNLCMPSYSFSCQTSFLTSMAQEGFDFNACIKNGISYISRVQESMVKGRNPYPKIQPVHSCSSLSVVDSVFTSRIKSRVEHWWKACKDSNSKDDGALVKSLRKLILGAILFIEDRFRFRFISLLLISSTVLPKDNMESVQSTPNYPAELWAPYLKKFKTISHISDDLVPLVVPDKSGDPMAIYVVLTSSEEDKKLFMSEIQNIEDEQNLKVRGFREVIDVISSSNKPIIGYNCLHDFTFIHSKLIAPLPSTLGEFMCSLRLAFTNIVDVNHLSKEISALRKAKNLIAALSYLKRQFFVPIDIELPAEDEDYNNKAHGHNVLRITHLFATLCALLKLFPDGQIPLGQNIKAIEDYSNIFYPICVNLQESDDEELDYTMDVKKVSTDNLMFLWGFGHLTFKELKHSLQQVHDVFMNDFELQFMDKTCAAVVFSRSESADILLEEIRSGKFYSDSLLKKIPGLKAAGYEAYTKVCKLGLWEADLADSLENVTSKSNDVLLEPSAKDAYEVYWRNELAIDMNDY
ncbi:hypothetical protein Cni_G20109 [Canna indica]|uniref:Uncharacterized protein n=1 Tax=Canna indica TaxID=4628 RepID=A0AAQ3KPD1_9LILI|nr:hypothetical protein Cni_G20109 [Canna indica]